jgi:hypothetical protein
LFLLAGALYAAGPYVDPTTKFDDSVTPGQKVTFKTTFPMGYQPTAHLYLVGGNEVVTSSATPDSTGVITFQLPSKLDAGRYYLTLTYKDPPDAAADTVERVPGELRVNPGGVRLDYAHPATAYREEGASGFDFDVIGDDFSTNPENDSVIVDGQGDIIATHGSSMDCANPATKKPCLWVENAQKMHVVGYRGEPYQGPVSLSVRVGSVTSATKQQLILARMSPPRVLFIAIATFAILCYVIYLLVRGGVDPHIIDGKRLSPWAAFFLDRETNSYSLSKFQLFLFAFVFIFGYLYVFFCRWLVQWAFVLPDIPSNLAGMLAISAGTTITAAGATNARGSKGGGNILPTFADFVSTGGLVVPERFQFFVWTVVASFGFLALLISQNPATITGFPSFPDGLLYVMGVSSAGYLGGKLVRKPGPVIRNIAVNTKSDPPAVIVQGENLSSRADFFIDGQKLPIVPDDQKPKDAQGNLQPMIDVTPQTDGSDPAFAIQLKIKINQKVAKLDLGGSDHVFRIMNPDGQFHDCRFTANPPTIAGVSDTGTAGVKAIKPSDQEVEVTVTGSGFQAASTGRWTMQGAANPAEIPAEKIGFVDAQTLKVTLVPGPAGSGTLLIQTPNGFTATASVVVQA